MRMDTLMPAHLHRAPFADPRAYAPTHAQRVHNRIGFLRAVKEMLCKKDEDGFCLVSYRPLVIMDNAIIHHCPEFEALVKQAGGIVRFLPPYCWHLTPLDNGLFGLMVRRVRAICAADRAKTVSAAIDEALSNMSPADCRMCFHNCEYS